MWFWAYHPKKRQGRPQIVAVHIMPQAGYDAWNEMTNGDLRPRYLHNPGLYIRHRDEFAATRSADETRALMDQLDLPFDRKQLEEQARIRNGAIAMIITTLVLAGLAVGGVTFLWSRRRHIATAVDDAVIGSAATAVKGYRKFKQRVEDRAAQNTPREG
jgi:hypothetical protein